MTILAGCSCVAVTFSSTLLSGASQQLQQKLQACEDAVVLTTSLFVLGFAFGPLLWAPLGELYGRQVVFIGSHGLFVVFNAAAAGCEQISSLLVMRFLAGIFGSSTLINSGGTISDVFAASDRGLAMSFFAEAALLGPVVVCSKLRILFRLLKRIGTHHRRVHLRFSRMAMGHSHCCIIQWNFLGSRSRLHTRDLCAVPPSKESRCSDPAHWATTHQHARSSSKAIGAKENLPSSAFASFQVTLPGADRATSLIVICVLVRPIVHGIW